MKELTPYVLLLTGGMVLFFVRTNRKLYLYLWCFITYVVTLIIEIAGVKTGIFFGSYLYSDVLGFAFYGVPLIIGFNWLMIIMASINIAQSAERNFVLTAILAATLSVIFDLVLEPVAVKLNYWSWEGNIIPLKNYYSWFIIAFCFSIFASAMKIKFNSVFLEHYYLSQILFFILLSVFI
jgi:putative membrane protein